MRHSQSQQPICQMLQSCGELTPLLHKMDIFYLEVVPPLWILSVYMVPQILIKELWVYLSSSYKTTPCLHLDLCIKDWFFIMFVYVNSLKDELLVILFTLKL